MYAALIHSAHPMDPTDIRTQLAAEREQFRATLPAETEQRWRDCGKRIGVVLAGGGARGAYEAGVLAAFQDARLPTHILAATSIGSINAASYAAHSETLVGEAEPMLNSWFDLTPPAVGIDWSRYVLVLGGLVAATAGIGNFLRQWMRENDAYVHLTDPKLTWLALAAAGLAVMFFYDHLSYIGHIMAKLLRNRRWRPDTGKAVRSIAANVLVWGFITFVLSSTHFHVGTTDVLQFDPGEVLLGTAAVVLALAFSWIFRDRLSLLSRGFLRLPLRSGLFANFERQRYLSPIIPSAGLRASPMHVVLTAADLRAGREAYFCNHSPEDLIKLSGVDSEFIRSELEVPDDDMVAVMASSAFPLVYEAVPMHGRLWTDGGIVGNEPLRPAVRLGAEVLFLVMVEPRVGDEPEVRTFLDVGVRAIDILMATHLRKDLRVLKIFNSVCERHAAELKVPPEQVVVEMGNRRFRYLKPFVVQPAKPLQATVLDFDGRLTGPAILQGYKDGCQAIRDFMEYIATAPTSPERYVLRLHAEKATAAGQP
jgi:predicted acylesterase/phospholipase RssA